MENKTLTYWKGFGFLMIALNIVMICFLITTSFGKGHHGPPDQSRDEAGKYLTETLKFTKEQETAFYKLKEHLHDTVSILRKEGKLLHEAFFEGLKQDGAFAQRDTLAKQIAMNQTIIEMATYNHFAAVRQICTPEQKLKFNEVIQEVLRRMGPPRMKRPENEKK